jgi:hypothetical protein
VLITLSTLAEKVAANDPAPEFKLKDLIAQSEDTGNVQKFAEPMKRKNKVKKPKVRNETAAEFSGDSDENVKAANVVDDDMSRFD